VNKNINNKIINRKIAKDLKINVCMGGVCSTSDDIEKTYDELLGHKDKFEKVVIKRPTGASGKGIYIIENKSKLRLYLKRILKINSEPKNQWLVEGWYRKKHDLSFQIYISEQGNVEVFSLKEQILNDAVYIGSKFPAELEVKDIMSIKEYAYKIGKYIFNMGFTGIAGVDSIITADGTIIPIIEINGRMTLTTYLSYVGKTLNQKCYMSRYIRVGTSKPFPYSEITKVFKDEGILMDQASKKGVLIYNSRTLPSDEAINEGLYIGRIFVIIAGENWTEVDEYNKKLDKCVAKFNLIRVF